MFKCLKDSLVNKDYILKKDLEEVTGGVIKAHTFFNLSKKNKIDTPEKIKIGNKTGYRTEEVIEWLEKNAFEEKNTSESPDN